MNLDEGGWQRVLTQTTATSYLRVHTPGLFTHYRFKLTATDLASNTVAVEAQTVAPVITKYYVHGGARVAMRVVEAGSRPCCPPSLAAGATTSRTASIFPQNLSQKSKIFLEKCGRLGQPFAA